MPDAAWLWSTLKGRFPHGKRGLKSRHCGYRRGWRRSLPPREAWIEIDMAIILSVHPRSLPPREAWIEICHILHGLNKSVWSLPPREAWIEISASSSASAASACRFPHGKRGLKFLVMYSPRSCLRRFPHGKRGLKYCGVAKSDAPMLSLPPREAWIEMRV